MASGLRAAGPEPPRQCHGITKKLQRCGITTRSKLETDTGALAAGPLLAGRDFCVFHGGGPRPDLDNPGDPLVLPLVPAAPGAVPPGAPAPPAATVSLGEGSHGDGAEEAGPETYRIVYFDLETVRLIRDPEEEAPPSGRRVVDPRRERVVEIGAVCAATGAEFQQLIWPGGQFPEPHVTGLTNHEVWRSSGGEFREVFARFCAYLEARPAARGACRGPVPSLGPAGGPGREPRDPWAPEPLPAGSKGSGRDPAPRTDEDEERPGHHARRPEPRGRDGGMPSRHQRRG